MERQLLSPVLVDRHRELTVRAFVLGAVLSVILAAANAYLGLFAGMTVSASIPAAVISMALLRALGNSSLLENNLVQTAASAGESLVAGVVFTLPAMVIGHHWGGFAYWETSIIACFGGLLGVLFTIPLRRSLIVEEPLRFPEGVATAEVLRVGQGDRRGIEKLVWAGVIGAGVKLIAGGLRVTSETAEVARSVGGSVAYFGTNLSPALVGVGYVVGLNIGALVFIGGAINWWIIIPLYVQSQGGVAVDAAAIDVATEAWSAVTRFVGVGAMAVGGLAALIKLRTSLVRGIRSGFEAYRHSAGAVRPRTEQDIPMPYVFAGAAVSLIPLTILFHHFTDDVLVSMVAAIIMLVAGFLFSAVAAYMAGLVGSSNNPISGVTIATVLSTSLLLLALLGAGNTIGPVAAILIGGVVCCAAAIGGDNMQDLKTGHIVGATPWKQQVMQVVGVMAAAFAIAPVLSLLHRAYGIGIAIRPDTEPLAAPQASLTEAVSKLSSGFEQAGLPWSMIFLGMGLAVVILIVDAILERRQASFRMPVLAVAVGIYLPFKLSVPILLGGAVAYLSSRAQKKRSGSAGPAGLLFAAGLITGEALAGIALAIPIAITGDINALQLTGGPAWAVGPEVPWLGLALFAGVVWGTWKVATSRSEAST